MRYEIETQDGGYTSDRPFHQSKQCSQGETLTIEIVDQWGYGLFDLDYQVQTSGLYDVQIELNAWSQPSVKIRLGANTIVLSLLAGLRG